MELAVLGGSPAFHRAQHVGGPIVEPETRERFHRLADAAFDANYLTNDGPLVQRLEEEIAVRHAVPHAILVSNATIAQMLVMKAMGLEDGEALVAANTFISTPHNCRWLGMRVRFVDIDPVTLNMDMADLRRKIGPESRVVIPTHIFGVFADLPALIHAASGHDKLAVIADAAHAFDCTGHGVMAGGSGIPEFLSLHATKYFSTLEGGAILTGDASLAQEIRHLRNFGFDQPMDAGGLGTNAKLPEISAAFGLASLPALEQRRQSLMAVRQTYQRELAGVPGLLVHAVDVLGKNNYRYFALMLDEGFGLTRDELAEVLRRENVLPRMYFYPGCHRHSYYRKNYPDQVDSLPVTDACLSGIICLPTSFVEVDPVAAARTVGQIIVTAHEQAGAVKKALSPTL